MRRRFWLGPLALFLTVFAVATCGGPSHSWDGDYQVNPACRANPLGCEGDIGGLCGHQDDCDEGVCCLSRDCGGGMCTYLCGGAVGCPFGMRCDDGFCFFTCSNDNECAPNQRCRENNTICRYD
jgi:hypothetical protein